MSPFVRPFVPPLLVAALSLPAVPARADPQSIGSFSAWTAYVSHGAKGGDQDVCYISARPVTKEPRPGVFAEVTHRPAEHHFGVIDFLESGAFKSGAPATLAIGKQVFTLFTHGAAAFAHDEDDSRIVAAMRGGAGTMVLSATTGKNKPVKDVFSLAGMEPAFAAIGKACHAPGVSARKSGK